MYEDGSEGTLAPYEIFGQEDGSVVSSFNAPRADFNGSLIQFMIGLVQTTMAPEDVYEWDEFIENPPGEDEVKSAFNSVSDAFNLNGKGYRFMQDLSVKDSKEPFKLEHIIPSLSGNDFFQKFENFKGICPVCAAMSLYTLQVNGYTPGRGHKSGLRGKGPLTTIVLGKNVPQTVMLNILPEDKFYTSPLNESKTEINDIFPWMGSIKTSEKKGTGIINPENANELQMFWGMGLRYYYDYENVFSGRCDICNKECNNLIYQTFKQPHGIKYENWNHILTPYYKKTKKSNYSPFNLRQGRINYSNWLGVVQNDVKNGKRAARVVNEFYENNDYLQNSFDLASKKPKLWSFGYNYPDAKARGWYESQIPLFLIEPEISVIFENHAYQIIKTAEKVDKQLTVCIAEALYKDLGKNSKKSKRKTAKIPEISQRFWIETEPFFYEVLEKIISKLRQGDDPSETKIEWLNKIRNYTLEEIFDFYSQSQYMDSLNPKQIIGARKKFVETTVLYKVQKELGVSLKRSTKF